MRRALVVVGVVASVVLTPPARLAVVGAAVLWGSGCSKHCALEITTPNPLPDGRVGQPYFVQFQVTGECANSARWDVTDGLPSGMKVSQEGALDGVPSQAGTYSFTIGALVIDLYGTYSETPTDSRDYTLTILPRS